MSEADTLTPSKAFTQIQELYGQTLGDPDPRALPDIMGTWIRLTPPERQFHLAKLSYAQVELLEELRKEIRTGRAILTVLGGDLLERANIGLELLAQVGEEEGGSEVEETGETNPGDTCQAEPSGHHQAGEGHAASAEQASESDHRDAGEPGSKVSGGEETSQLPENIGEEDGSAADSAEPLEEGEKEEELSLAEVMAGMDDDDPNEVGEDDDLVGLEEDDQAEEDDHQEEEDDRAEPEKNSATVRQEDQDKSAGSFQEDGQPQPAKTSRQDLAAVTLTSPRRQPSFPGAAA